jgi:hypothetical protein
MQFPYEELRCLAALEISKLPDRWRDAVCRYFEKNKNWCEFVSIDQEECEECEEPAEFLLVGEPLEPWGPISFQLILSCPEHARDAMLEDESCQADYSPCGTDRVN